MKLFLLCLLAVAVHAKVVTRVTVSSEAIEASGQKVTFPCEFVLDQDVSKNDTQPPIIYWMKGVSVDDVDAVIIFKGYKYWNESLGEYRQFFNGYGERAVVPDLAEPSLQLSGLTNADEGRYWCMIAEWSGRQQEGTDTDSVALLRTTTKFVDTDPNVIDTIVPVGESVAVPCSGKGDFNVVAWYKGPFHLPDSENFTHTEVGTYDKIGYRDLTSDKVFMDPNYDTMTIDAKYSLIISTAESNARFWCELSNTNADNIELETSRASRILQVKFPEFLCENNNPGTHPDPEDCSMYYECAVGDPITYHRSCGYDGLVYDEVNGYCDWAANVPPPCGTSIV